MKKVNKTQTREIEVLTKMDEGEIDLSEIPEASEWRNPLVGRFYRPIKKAVTIRLDIDVLLWVRASGKGYQTRINGLLRSAMNQEIEHTKEPTRHRAASSAALVPKVEHGTRDTEDPLFRTLSDYDNLFGVFEPPSELPTLRM